MKLTPAQNRTLAEVARTEKYRPMFLAESFPPRKKLLELKFIREVSPNWFKTTEAGRTYLESLSS